MASRKHLTAASRKRGSEIAETLHRARSACVNQGAESVRDLRNIAAEKNLPRDIFKNKTKLCETLYETLIAQEDRKRERPFEVALDELPQEYQDPVFYTPLIN